MEKNSNYVCKNNTVWKKSGEIMKIEEEEKVIERGWEKRRRITEREMEKRERRREKIKI